MDNVENDNIFDDLGDLSELDFGEKSEEQIEEEYVTFCRKIVYHVHFK